MNILRFAARPGLICAATMLVAGAAHLQAFAQTETESLNTTFSGITNYTGTLGFAQFDPSLGTLQSVEVVLTPSVSSTIAVTNISFLDPAGPSASNGTASTLTNFTITGNALPPNSLDIALQSNQFTYTVGPGGTVTSAPPLTGSGLVDVSYTSLANPALLSTFIGAGNINLTGTATSQSQQLNFGGSTALNVSTVASVTGHVTYTYTSSGVPEPATLSLFAMGMVSGAGVLRRRRRSA